MATVDITLKDEGAVLKARDPNEPDENQWPEFLLENVSVYQYQSTESSQRELVSVLDANLGSPVEVVGELSPVESDQEKLLVKRPHTVPVRLRLSEVESSSFAEFEDDKSIGIWALGEAGWFWIQPSTEYQDVYHEMTCAVKLWYKLSDNHTLLWKESTKQPKATAEEMIQLCDELRSDSEEKPSQAVLANHAVFFVSEMSKDRKKSKNRKWHKMPLWFWLQKRARETATKEQQERTKSSGERASSPAASDSSPQRARKSILTPKPKVASKAASRAALEAATSASEASDDMDSEQDTSSRSRSLRKRKRVPRYVEDEDSPPVLEGDPDGRVDEPKSIQKSRDSSDKAQAAPAHRPAKDDSNSARYTLAYEPLISTLGNEDDIWTCTMEPCKHKEVYASTNDGQERIQKHLASHLPEAQAQVDLVLSERRPQLPVYELLNHIIASSKDRPLLEEEKSRAQKNKEHDKRMGKGKAQA